MSQVSPYYEKYPGRWLMEWHDGYSELKRWFDNWKLEKYVSFGDTEWLTIQEYSLTCRGKKITRYDGVIGADHDGRRRKVSFETGAPPPPTFFMPAKRKYEPSPPEPAWVTQRRHQDFLRSEAAFNSRTQYLFTPQQIFVANVLPAIDPPPPRYRRN